MFLRTQNAWIPNLVGSVFVMVPSDSVRTKVAGRSGRRIQRIRDQSAMRVGSRSRHLAVVLGNVAV